MRDSIAQGPFFLKKSANPAYRGMTQNFTLITEPIAYRYGIQTKCNAKQGHPDDLGGYGAPHHSGDKSYKK